MVRQLGGASGADDELLDVVVIGGSQAGLAMAWHLARQHLRFVVLEAGPEPGHTWRSRWDSLTLFTPAQYAALPGMPFPGPPDTYPTKEQVAGYLNAYAAEFNLPVRLNARVTALILTAEGFEARTDDGVFRARQVVVATGPFQAPHVPPTAQRLDGSVTQLHSGKRVMPRPPRAVTAVSGPSRLDCDTKTATATLQAPPVQAIVPATRVRGSTEHVRTSKHVPATVRI